MIALRCLYQNLYCFIADITLSFVIVCSVIAFCHGSVPRRAISTMSDILVDDSSDEKFEEDSLDDNACPHHFDSLDDLDEIPESPVDMKNGPHFAKNETAFNSAGSSLTKSLESGGKHSSTNVSISKKRLPTVNLGKNQCGGEKILDYRNIISQRLGNKPTSFGSMKFKDFKEAKKALKQGKSMADSLTAEMMPSKAKKPKLETISSNCSTSSSSSSYVSQQMHKMKHTLGLLAKCVTKLEHQNDQSSNQPSTSRPFINKRQTVLPSEGHIIAENTMIESHDVQQNEIDDLFDLEEIPDSLDSTVSEIMESDLEGEEDNVQPITLKASTSNQQFVKSRKTVLQKNVLVYAEETIAEIDEDPSKYESSNESLVVQETVIHSSSADDNMSSDSLSNVDSFQTNIKQPTAQTGKEDGELKMAFFQKKKKNPNLVDKYNHNVAGSSKDQQQKVKMLHSPVRKKKDRKQLLAFICKDCQDYYSTRDLSEEQLKKLVQDCSRHRGQHSPYRSPSRFWEIDFPSSQEKTKVNVTPRKAPTSLRNVSRGARNDGHKSHRPMELGSYDDWADNIDANSRESNVLHSTKLL